MRGVFFTHAINEKPRQAVRPGAVSRRTIYCADFLRLPTLRRDTMNTFEYFFGVRVF